MVTNTINNNINATVTFSDADLSFFKSFPQASLTVKNIAVINKIPFEGDTLFSTQTLSLNMSITELFKKADETINLKSIVTSNGKVNVLINKNNIANFDIALKNTTSQNTENNNSFSFSIQEYTVDNLQFNYVDESSKIKLQLDNIYHTGEGNFANEVLDLDTKSKAKVSFYIDNVNYLKNVAISLDAVLGIDLKNSKYSFKENTAYINQLPLEFNGFIQLKEKSQLYDLSFKTPTSSFKNALALLPEQYSGNLKSIQTEGNFNMNGIVSGSLSEKTIPTFNISLSSKNAMFKYADLPKAVKNINIDSKFVNKTGNIKDTYVNLNHLNFKIDEDVFSANGNVYNITTNPKVSLVANGVINLANINKVYPIKLENELAGILEANITTSFDMNSVEKENYQNIKNKGNIALSNFKYDGKDVANPFLIDKTSISFNTNSIKLNEFNAKTGASDIAINGNLDNFYGFLFKKQELKGSFTLNSSNLEVNDFLSKDAKTDEKTIESALKVPSFLNVKLSAKAQKVVYDNINLTNVSGIVFIKDETINLQDLKSDVFGGNIGFSGNVSTKGETASFNMDLNLKELNISDSFSNLEMLKSIAPIAKTIEGKINSTIKVSGLLNNDMTPNLKTISGDLLGQLLNTKLKASNSKVLSLLGQKVSFLDINKLNLHEATGLFSFKNGEVSVKPIKLNYQDIGIQLSGKHGFDETMNYDVVFDVPVKYLGTDVTSMIAKLTPKDAATVKSLPIKGKLLGSFSSPSFTTNIKDATSNLVKELVEKQKQNLKDEGKDKLKQLLGLDKNDSIKKDSTTNTKDKIKNVLGGLFGKKKKDTTKQN
ncbi:AsmA-like C-terminal region-containing protein [Polaribacter sp. MSW13]|uniref:AsmA-like C-terminal region-containing protein n=1 Tax=Polaribacter marinus TaxID=2916838 RepID=A0A9X1VLG5_9FLAO|nr:AsmA-like C-terminal region-containing protein [Polaribacter marinus]MCI2228332.1 AsmA-like C-terminal region-containing protein [Polaribacter marinus]